MLRECLGVLIGRVGGDNLVRGGEFARLPRGPSVPEILEQGIGLQLHRLDQGLALGASFEMPADGFQLGRISFAEEESSEAVFAGAGVVCHGSGSGKAIGARSHLQHQHIKS